MKVVITVKKEIDVKFLRVEIPIRFEEDMPADFPGRTADNCWEALIDLDTHRIVGWPDGQHETLYIKVCDSGGYTLYGPEHNKITEADGIYVPAVLPNEYADYLNLEIAADGTIVNWPRNPDLSEFFHQDRNEEEDT